MGNEKKGKEFLSFRSGVLRREILPRSVILSRAKNLFPSLSFWAERRICSIIIILSTPPSEQILSEDDQIGKVCKKLTEEEVLSYSPVERLTRVAIPHRIVYPMSANALDVGRLRRTTMDFFIVMNFFPYVLIGGILLYLWWKSK